MTIRATEAELRAVAAAAGDASGYFPAMYARVTGRIGDAIDAGRFDDGPRMDRFATTFAAYYTRAQAGPPPPRPRCWQACRDVAADRSLLIVQHLLLGINAHVNHDLALAVVDVARATGDLASVRPDFDAVNDFLGETYHDVLADLDRVSRWANEVASLGGGRVFNFSLRVARRQAWGAAQRLHAFGDDEAARRRYVAELDRLVSVLAYLVTRPSPAMRPVLWLARRLEEDDPRVVTEALLGGR